VFNPLSPNLPSASRRQALRGLAEGLAVVTLAGLSSEVRADVVAPITPPATAAITPFRVAGPQASIDDLKQRLRLARFPEKETVTDWTQGVPLNKAKALVAYWRASVTFHKSWSE